MTSDYMGYVFFKWKATHSILPIARILKFKDKSTFSLGDGIQSPEFKESQGIINFFPIFPYPKYFPRNAM